MTNYTVPTLIRLNRFLLRPVFRGLFHILSQVRIHGRENIPAKGPYLVVINHISIFEPPFLLAFWPIQLEAVGAVEIWDRPGQARLARLYGGIQAHRGEYDRALIEKVLAAIRSGYSLLIAPEGSRSHIPGLRRGMPGVAYIVDKTHIPVIPVGIVGSTEDFFQKAIRRKRPVLEMRIGQPFHLPQVTGRGAERRAFLQRNVDQVMKKIAALLPVDYQGVYASFEL